MDARVERDSILLYDNLLLHQSVDLLLEEVDFVDVVDLEFLEVFLQVSDVLDDLLQNIVGSLSGMVFQSCAL